MLKRIKRVTIENLVKLARRVLSGPEMEKALAEVLVRTLDDDEVRKAIWSATQYRPAVLEYHWGKMPNSIEEARYQIATGETARYVTDNMSGIPNFADPYHVLNFCMDRLEMEGEILEFGVFVGGTINHIARQTERQVHGFDSFRGLPEKWGNAPAGRYDLEGTLPVLEPNVELHIGLFDDTLPVFIQQHAGPIAFLHIDCDLYSSARTVLTALKDQIVTGTMIVFDEYFNYPTWQEHEHKAFWEFIKDTGNRYEYIAYTDKGFSAAVRIL